MVRKTAAKKPVSSKRTREERALVPQENGKPEWNSEIAQKRATTASKESIVLPTKGSTSDEETGAVITDARGTKKREATSRNPSSRGRKLPSKATTSENELNSNGQEASEDTKNGSFRERSSKLDSNVPPENATETTNPSLSPGSKANAVVKAAAQEQGSPKRSSPFKDRNRANPKRNKKSVRKPGKDSEDVQPKQVSELMGSEDSSVAGVSGLAQTYSSKPDEQHQQEPDKDSKLSEQKENSVMIKANIGKKTSMTGKAKQEESGVENSEGQVIVGTETAVSGGGSAKELKDSGAAKNMRRKKAQPHKQKEQSQEEPSKGPKQHEDETSLHGKATGGRRAPKSTARGKEKQLEPSTGNAESQELKSESMGNEEPEDTSDTAEDAQRKDLPKKGKKRGTDMAAAADDKMEAIATKKPQRAAQRKKASASSKTDSNTSLKTHASAQRAAKGSGTKQEKNATEATKTGKGTKPGPSPDNEDAKEEEKEEPTRKRLKRNDATATGSERDIGASGQKSRSEESSKPWNIKICSWNVNGVRSWLAKDGLNYLRTEDPDILTIQETKCADAKLPKEVKEPEGYHAYFIGGDQEGYSGVGLLTKVKPMEVKYGIGIEKHDKEGRVITAEFEKFVLVATYVPNAGRKLVRLEYRMEWDKDFCSYLQELEKRKPVVLCGDLNVAHQPIDLANPKTNKRNAGFTDEEREGFTTLLSKGFLDSFRHLYPDAMKAYTFWTYMMNARAKDVGWRLDYFVLSKSLEANLSDSIIQKEVMGSDHCPIKLLLNM